LLQQLPGSNPSNFILLQKPLLLHILSQNSGNYGEAFGDITENNERLCAVSAVEVSPHPSNKDVKLMYISLVHTLKYDRGKGKYRGYLPHLRNSFLTKTSIIFIHYHIAWFRIRTPQLNQSF
jgi:hypothetical protein